MHLEAVHNMDPKSFILVEIIVYTPRPKIAPKISRRIKGREK
jgi:hypothetical protein